MMDYRKAAELEYADRADDYAQRDEERWDHPTGTTIQLKRLIEELKPQSILELGVGTGRYFPYLAGKMYTGVDISRSMLIHARGREGLLITNGFQKIILLEEEIISFLKAGNGHNSYDLVFSIGCIGYHVPVTKELFAGVAKFLKPSGFVFLQTTQQSNKYKLKSYLRRWKNILLHREENSKFFLSTSSTQLKKKSTSAGLNCLWIKEDQKQWFDKPLLLSLYQKPVKFS